MRSHVRPLSFQSKDESLSHNHYFSQPGWQLLLPSVGPLSMGQFLDMVLAVDISTAGGVIVRGLTILLLKRGSGPADKRNGHLPNHHRVMRFAEE